MSDASSIPATGAARTAEVTRNTLETRIRVRVDLDGTGKARLKTGVPFFEHMLDQIARHGLVDLDIEAEGDTHIDDHHTVEDVGIALGQALAQALGKPGEAAAEQQRFQPRRLGGQNEFRCAGAGAQALLPHTLQLRLAHALQQGHAAAQALLEIGDFAAHGRFGDGGHFSAAPCGGGDFVHALDVDEGGVHVKSDEPEMAQRRQGSGAAHEQARGDFAQGRGR